MNIVEISNKFPSELDAVKYFERVRWHKGRKCPYCNSDKLGKRQKDYRFHCYNCHKSFSATTGTKLHGTGIPLKKWLFAFALITDAKKGMSALQLQRNLDISYPTAHSIYMKIRRLMVEPREELEGVLEMDETYIGGKPRKKVPYYLTKSEKAELQEYVERYDIKEGKYKKPFPKERPKRGRGTGKTPIVGIVKRDGDVVAEVMRNLTSINLKEMVKKHVDKKDSLLITDSWKGYDKLDKIIEHIKLDHRMIYSYKGINTNTIESFWAIIKRGIMGQYHHVSLKYLPDYITEFVFKYNNRNKDDMFITLVRNSMKEKNKQL